MSIQEEKPSCNIYQNSSSPNIAVVLSSGGFHCVQCVRSIRWWRKTTCENVVLEVESMISRLHESLLIPSCDLDALQACKAPTLHSDPCFVNWWSKLQAQKCVFYIWHLNTCSDRIRILLFHMNASNLCMISWLNVVANFYQSWLPPCQSLGSL